MSKFHPAWGVIALATGGGAAAAVTGVAFDHPTAGLVIAGCVIISPWLLAAVLVCSIATLAMRRTEATDTKTDDPRLRMIEALIRAIEVLLRR